MPRKKETPVESVKEKKSTPVKKTTTTKVKSTAAAKFAENNIKVSVVVPCYKVEKYIRQAHESLANQTLKEIEIIYVHDGSPDNTLSILREFEQRDSRVVVIDQKNSGVGRAINVGLNACRGKYIAHMDADDYVSTHMLEDLYERSEKYNLDICISNFYKFSGEYETFRSTELRFQTDNYYYNRVFSPDDFLDKNSPDYLVGFAWCQTWSTLYRREFLDEHKIRWNEKVSAYNDLGFWFQTRTLCRRLMYVDKPYYFYRQDNVNSTINNLDKLFKDRVTESMYVKDKLIEHGIFEKFKSFYYDSKFRAYTGFILPKIGFDMKMKFVKHIYDEFSEYMEQGELDAKAFTPWRWKVLNQILSGPGVFFENYIKENYKISVILVMENAQDYVYEIMRDLINSQLTQIEIICIMNGSTDKTADILKGLANSDSRIVLTELSEKISETEAFNLGITLAHSVYVMFGNCSSDYKYHPFILNDVYETASTNNADIGVFRTVLRDVKSAVVEKDADTVDFKSLPENMTVFTEKDLPAGTFFGVIKPSIYDKIFKREFLMSNNLNIKNSQEEFVVKALRKANVAVDWRAPLVISVKAENEIPVSEENDYKTLINYISSLTNEVKQLKAELSSYKSDVINNYIMTNNIQGRVKFSYKDDRKITCAKLFTINLASEPWANTVVEIDFVELFNNKPDYERGKLFLCFSLSANVDDKLKVITAKWIEYSELLSENIFYTVSGNSLSIYSKFSAQNEGVSYKIGTLTSRKSLPTVTDILNTNDYTDKLLIPEDANFIEDIFVE